jgi:hypothetical protein
MMMQHFLIMQWRKAVHLLDQYDVVSANWRTVPVPHASGNFWWANASFIASLDPAMLRSDDRMTHEFWLSTRPVRAICMHETGLEHYSQSCPINSYSSAYFSPLP